MSDSELTDLHWKYRLRLGVVPRMASLGNSLGVGWNTLGEKLGREVLLSQVKSLKSDQVIEGADDKLDVIFLTMIGGHTYNASMDVALGMALRARGHRVRMVVCDQQFPVCEVKKAGKEDSWCRSCAKCWAFGSKYFEAAGFEMLPVSSLVKQDLDSVDVSRWKDIVDAALLKHYGRGVLEETSEVAEKRKMYDRSASIATQVGQGIIEMKPDRVIMSHGIYCTWGPQREMLNDAGIPVVTYGKGKKRSTQKFNWTTGSDWWDVSDEWSRVKDVPLTESENRIIDDYLESRKDHSGDTLVYNFGIEETLEETYRRLELDPGKQTFVLFTNVLWDAASAQREIVFKNPIDWVMRTIAWMDGNPNKQLVIKIHPAEVVIGTNQPFASIVKEYFSVLPTNVRLIEPHEKVNSWSIMRVASLGLVHTSTVGMELPLEGIPCAVVSRTHFRDRGFTIDVDTEEEYFNLLENFSANDVNSEEMMALSKRYAYLLFERYQLPWDCLYEVAHTDVRAFQFCSMKELIENSSIALFIRALERKAEFLLGK